MKVSKTSGTDRIGVSIVDEKFSRVGYVFREQPIVDCGVDAHVELLDQENATGKLIALQIKSGPSWFKKETENGFEFYGDNAHLEYWLGHSLPVLIVLCNIDSRDCFWQAVTPKNIIRTPKAWKILIPKAQQINAGMNVDLKRLVDILPVHNDFTVSSTSDVSHGAAKRYSLKIILNREHTQSELIDLIENQMTVARNCEYHRSEIVRLNWRNKPAQVVWIFIYPTAEDEKRNNFICKSEWISSELPKVFSPVSNGGEVIGDDIRIVWNDTYLSMSKFYSENEENKESYIIMNLEVAEQLKELMSKASKILKDYEDQKISYDLLVSAMEEEYSTIDEVYNRVNDSGLAPFECSDLDQNLRNILCNAHNVFLPFGGIGNSEDEKYTIYNIRSQLEYYYEGVPEFQIELKKVQ